MGDTRNVWDDLANAASLSADEVENLARKFRECAPKPPQGVSFDEAKQYLMSLTGMSAADAGQVLRNRLDRVLRPPRDYLINTGYRDTGTPE